MRVSVDCPLCSSDDSDLFVEAADPLSEDRFYLQQCRRCRLVYVSPRPSSDELPAYYPDGYFGRRHRAFQKFFMSLRVRLLPSSGGRLLDIGCGHGEFLAACRESGWEVTGVEQDGAPIMELRNMFGFDVLSTKQIPTIPDASFDVVTMWHVLEHMGAPREILAHAYRILRPGGLLVVEVPNLGSWQARLGPKYWFHLDIPRHLIHFDRDTLEGMLKAEELEPGSWATFSAEYDAFGLLQSLLNRLCDTHAYLFQILIDRKWPGTWRDAFVTTVVTPPLAIVAVLVSLVAPLFGQGGVLRVLARKPRRAVASGLT